MFTGYMHVFKKDNFLVCDIILQMSLKKPSQPRLCFLVTFKILGIIFLHRTCLNECDSKEIVTHSCHKISLYHIMLIISMAPKTMVDFTNFKEVSDFTVF